MKDSGTLAVYNIAQSSKVQADAGIDVPKSLRPLV
jgi:hypothetical protein